MNKRYGAWNSCKKEFQFGINEASKTRARRKLFEKIGNDAYKWRFTIKVIPDQQNKNLER